MKLARVTLRTIAVEVGLSTFAVSRALSGKDGVSEATRQAVRDTAKRLRYTPTRPAGEPRHIGVTFHDRDLVNSELHMQIQSGIQAEAQRLVRPVRLEPMHSPEQMLDFARRSAGLLMVGPHERATIEAIRTAGVPVVRAGWVDPLEPVDQVLGTDRESGAAVADFLIGLGHRRIAYVQGGLGLRGRVERFSGMRDAVEAHPDVSLRMMTFDEQEGFGKAFQSLCRTRFVPTAFFCAHDGLALTVVTELLGKGFRIPHDVSVVGFGDFSAATLITPQLTTVRQEGREMGAVALRLLIERIDAGFDPDMPARRVFVASRIIRRRSAGPVSAQRRGDA